VTAEVPARVDRAAIASWCLFDWAMSAFNTVIGTFVFAVYFTKGIAGDEVRGAALWGTMIGTAGVAVMLLSPLLGAIADHGGRKKAWLAALVLASTAATTLLWYATPEPGSIGYALRLVGIATVAFELSYVFYNALLLRVAPPAMLGRVSGWGWGIGYLGGLFCLATALVLLVGLDGMPPLLGLVEEDAENLRATGPLVALWWLVFAIPLFVFVPGAASGLPIGHAVTAGLAALRRTVAGLPAEGNLVRFLVASALYREGFNVLFAMGGIYAAGTFGLTFSALLLFAIGLNVTCGLGSIAFAYLDDGIGSKPTILIALAGLIAIAVPILLVDDKIWFIGLAIVLGLFLGPAQAASRTLMARLAPPGRETEMFGLFALTGRATGFVGPWAFAAATALFASQRAGMATVVLLFAAGGLLLLTVREGRRQPVVLS
jgi:UMF1 family MFS transporter